MVPQEFSSLSESSFIPTRNGTPGAQQSNSPGSHLFQRVASFLPTSALYIVCNQTQTFSSLSESSFIPTEIMKLIQGVFERVLISFRE